MSDTPGVELRGFTTNPNYPSMGNDRAGHPPNQGPGSWSESSQMGGGVNPTYQTINEPNGNHSRARADSGVDEYPMDPSGDRMYDFVPSNGTKVSTQIPPPVPPDIRRTTMNQMYESRGDTFSHPNVKGEKPLLVSDSISDADELESSGSSIGKTICLSILVLIGLLLAIVAVVLVMLLWFGVYSPTTSATTSCSEGTDPLTGGTTSMVAPTPSPMCDCPAVDLQPLYDEIEAEAANITKQIEMLNLDLDTVSDQSTATLNNLTSQANTIQSDVNSVNTSCYETLDTLLSQNVSVAGLNFEATLMNVGVYNSCIYEYLDDCTIGQNDNNCSTTDYSILVENYYNIELACHVNLIQVDNSAPSPSYAPISNLRFETKSGETLGSDPEADEILAKSNVRCECAKVALLENPVYRFDFVCKLFRARCPKVLDINTTITTPE